jgi:NADPH2:quinone reductase
MKALRVVETGRAPELIDIEIPTPRPGDVQIKVDACGLNFADLLMVQGKYQDTPPAPFTLGMEIAGTITALGDGVTHLSVGTRVAVFGGSGGLAEYGCFPSDLCLPLPNTMSSTEAAAFQVAYGTSHVALTHRAQMRAGERLLVLGAAGGVGLTAIEIGRHLGAEVIGVARGAEKCAIVKEMGADHVLDSDGDVLSALKALGGADVVYDPVGGELFKIAMRIARPEARLLAIGFASGDVPQVPANILLVKNLSVLGFYWGGYMRFRPDVVTDSLAQLMTWHSDGKVSPHISHVLPLDRAGEGLELLRTRKSTGKVVITP